MIRTGAQYREGLRDGREVWIDGERVADVAAHPALKPIIDIRARMYDMQHEAAARSRADLRGERRPPLDLQPPAQGAAGLARQVEGRRHGPHGDIKGVVTRVGDETVGEMWSLYDGRDVLNEIVRNAAGLSDKIKRSQ